MFSSTGLFKQVDCPEQPHCSLLKCIFAHHGSPTVKEPGSSLQNSDNFNAGSHEQDMPRKRRRISNSSDNGVLKESTTQDGPRRHPLPTSQARDGAKSSLKPEPANSPITMDREVSPPSLSSMKTKAAQNLLANADGASKLQPAPNSVGSAKMNQAKNAPQVSLNPRMIPRPPASHAIRLQLTTLLHQEMKRLNEALRQSQEHSKFTLTLSSEELVSKALSEEENVAKESAAVYPNVLGLRIAKLRKMQVVDWKEERIRQIARKDAAGVTRGSIDTPRIVQTDLSTEQEVAFLTRMLVKQNQLTKHGYVLKAPSDKEIAKAREGIEAAQGWEQCDRCKIRFQVFPGRAEDGCLTSGGTCAFHPAKPRRPIASSSADKDHKELTYACCNETIGASTGCTTARTHVFKVTDPKRLALVMPFEETPPRPLVPGPNYAVCFDCEMGYTTLGMELIRLTATSWPHGEELLDILVRPLGEVLDLNSQFSGVWPRDFSEAVPFGKRTNNDTEDPRNITLESKLPLAESPSVARRCLFDLLAPATPLLGHALDNDLNATRIIHPSIVDSVLLYPHPRGLPMRYGLKMLMKRHLNRDIQTAGADGHDSKEDARAAGDLVRLKVADAWKLMRRDGWSVKDREFLPPPPANPRLTDTLKTYGTKTEA